MLIWWLGPGTSDLHWTMKTFCISWFQVDILIVISLFFKWCVGVQYLLPLCGVTGYNKQLGGASGSQKYSQKRSIK